MVGKSSKPLRKETKSFYPQKTFQSLFPSGEAFTGEKASAESHGKETQWGLKGTGRFSPCYIFAESFKQNGMADR